jgi:hypothetical protein
MSIALGASAAVLAIVMAISFMCPTTPFAAVYRPVKLKYIALQHNYRYLSIRSGNAVVIWLIWVVPVWFCLCTQLSKVATFAGI